VVEAKRVDPRAGLMNRSGFVSMVEMARRRDRVEDLPHVLSQLVGVRVRQYGGLGSFATVSIRGSSSSQVNVYLDGIPVNDPYLGTANIGDLPLGGVETVEVYRGFSPPYLGGSAIGGAVNLVTIPPGGPSHDGTFTAFDADASYGSFDTSRQQFTALVEPQWLRLKLHAGHSQSLGNFEYLDDNGTPDNPDDDEFTIRINNDFESLNFMGTLGANAGEHVTITAGYDEYQRENGVPGIGNNQSLTARSERERRLGHVTAETDMLWQQLRAAATGFYARTHERFSDPEGKVSLLKTQSDNRIDVYGGRASSRWLLPLVPVVLDANVENRKEEFHPVQLLPQTREGPNQWRQVQSGALTGELYLLRERVVLSATQRWERWESEYWEPPRFPWLPATPSGRVEGNVRTPSAGIRVQALSWLALKANAGRYQRLPTFLEMFGNTGSITGNPALAPESGTNRDIGLIANVRRLGVFENLYLEVTYIDNEAEDLILFIRNSQSTARPENIASSHIRGWEMSMRTFITGSFDVAANYTRLDALNTTPIPEYEGRQLPSRPQGDLNLAASRRWRRWRLTYEFTYMAANFLNRANLREVPARELHGLILRWDLPVRGLSFTIEGRNLTDNQVSDISDFPLPGRAVFSTLRFDTALRR